MAIGKIKSLLFATSVLTILSMVSKSSIAIAFDKKKGEPILSGRTDGFAEDIARTVDYTDLQDRNSVEYLSQKIRFSSEEYARASGYGGFQRATIVRANQSNTVIVSITGENLNIQEYGLSEKSDDQVARYFTNYDYSMLAKDISNDDYDRTLKYIWIDSPTKNFDLGEIATAMLNDILISEGYAEIALYSANQENTNEFELAEYAFDEEYDYA